jgi:hypothetical protein
MSVNPIFQQHCERIMKNGKNTLFWTNKWVNNSPLSVQFPRLFLLTFQKEITFSKAKAKGWGVFGSEEHSMGRLCNNGKNCKGW